LGFTAHALIIAGIFIRNKGIKLKGFSHDAKPPVNGGGNDGARDSSTTKSPGHQESSGEYCLTNGVTWCLGVLVVRVIFAFNSIVAATAALAILPPPSHQDTKKGLANIV